MLISGPSFNPDMDFSKLATFADKFGEQGTVSGGIAIFGPAAAYGLVWEYGSSRMHEPGPKTLWSVNSLGEPAILTRQAPLGYISIHEDEFWPILQEEFGKVDFHSSTADGIRIELEIAMDNSSQRIAQLVAASAPVDSGDLRSSIQYVDSSKLQEE